MCTGNSCRSIIGEALINENIVGVAAYSAGVKPSGKVNINAKKVLIFSFPATSSTEISATASKTAEL